MHWLKVVRYMDGLIKSEYRGKCPLSDACWQPATFFWSKIIIHQSEMAESGCNTVSYISAIDVLCKKRKFLFSMWFVLINCYPCNNCEICNGCRTPGLLLVRGTCLSFYTHTSKIYIFKLHIPQKKNQLKITTLIGEAPCHTSGILFVGKSLLHS